MPFLTKGKTNWKYILIVAFLATIVGGGILVYLRYFNKEILSLAKFPEIKKPEKVVKEETANWKTYRNEKYGFEFKYPEVPPQCKYCVLKENKENDEIELGTISLQILDSQGLTLSDFVDKRQKELGLETVEECIAERLNAIIEKEGGELTEEDKEEIKKECQYKEIIVGNERGLRSGFVDVEWIYLEKNGKIYLFTIGYGDTCCPEIVRTGKDVYEIRTREAILSTFRFLK